MKQVTAIIVAGGSGKRMGTNIKKQFIEMNEKEILAHTIETFNRSKVIDDIIVVVGEEDCQRVQEDIVNKYGYYKVSKVVKGGKERQDSVYNGLIAVQKETEYVMIHDGARPFISETIIEKALKVTKEKKATVVAVPVKDTIKVVNQEGKVEGTPNRSTLWSVQTPQSFEKQLLMRAYEFAREKKLDVTDDSMIVEAYGSEVHIVEGEYNNIKITTIEDLDLGQAILKNKTN